jgi:hypothetical protein
MERKRPSQQESTPQPRIPDRVQQQHPARPNVLDVLERDVRLSAPDVTNRPNEESREFLREWRKVRRLENELEERGTPQDRLILDLFVRTGMTSPYVWPGHRKISLEEFQQFRARVEPMSEDELREENNRLKDEWSRKYDPNYSPHSKPQSPTTPTQK